MKILKEAFEFNNNNLTQLKADIRSALEPISKKYDLKIEAGTISYSDNDATLKLNILPNRDPADQFMVDYHNSYLFAYPITKDMYGKTFTGEDGNQYKLVGIKRTPRRTNKVLLIRNSNGTEYVCTPEFLGINQKGVNTHVNF